MGTSALAAVRTTWHAGRTGTRRQGEGRRQGDQGQDAPGDARGDPVGECTGRGARLAPADLLHHGAGELRAAGGPGHPGHAPSGGQAIRAPCPHWWPSPWPRGLPTTTTRTVGVAAKTRSAVSSEPVTSATRLPTVSPRATTHPGRADRQGVGDGVVVDQGLLHRHVTGPVGVGESPRRRSRSPPRLRALRARHRDGERVAAGDQLAETCMEPDTAEGVRGRQRDRAVGESPNRCSVGAVGGRSLGRRGRRGGRDGAMVVVVVVVVDSAVTARGGVGVVGRSRGCDGVTSAAPTRACWWSSSCWAGGRGVECTPIASDCWMAPAPPRGGRACS